MIPNIRGHNGFIEMGIDEVIYHGQDIKRYNKVKRKLFHNGNFPANVANSANVNKPMVDTGYLLLRPYRPLMTSFLMRWALYPSLIYFALTGHAK